MATIPFPFSQPTTTHEAAATVQPDHNALRIHLRDHTWVSVSKDDQELVREHSSEPMIEFTLAPGLYQLRTDGMIESTHSRQRGRRSPLPSGHQPTAPFYLKLTTDAPDQHVVDGIGEVPADGRSFCTITVERTTLDGSPYTQPGGDDEIFLRTTGGIIMDDIGEQRIRSIYLDSGRGSFRLVADTSPRVVTVSVFGRDPLLARATIQVEFI